MALAALAIDEANNAGDRALRQVLREKHIQAIEEARHHDVFSAERFDVGNLSGLFRRHTGTLPSLTDTGALSELRLRDSGAIHRDGYAGSVKLIFQR